MISDTWKKWSLYVFALLNLGVIILIWLTASGVALMDGRIPAILRSLSNLAAMLAVYLILLQLLLIGRTRWIEQVFGLDRLSVWHHLIGLAIPILVVIHPVFLALSAAWGTKNSWWTALWRMIDYMEDVGKAAIAVVLFLVLVGLSILIVYRKYKYEVWYFTHLLLYVAILLAFGHQLGLGDDFTQAWARWYWYALYAFVFINLLYCRFFLPVWRTWRHGFRVARLAQENKNCNSIYLTGKDLKDYPIKAGQFLIVRFLDAKRWWQAHPFSLSCAPHADHLRITIKNLGDYTSHISGLKPGTRVLIDGPHGIFTLDKARQDKFLLIAGGIGITPIRSLAEQVVEQGKDAILLYACKTKDDPIFMSELQEMATRGRLKLCCIMSHDGDWEGEKGFLDQEKIRRLAPDHLERDVYVCGPSPMAKAVISVLRQLGLPKSQIHYEKFSL